MAPKAVVKKTGAKKVKVASPLFASTPKSQRIGGAIRVSF